MTGTTGLTVRGALAADMTDVHAVVLAAGLRSGRDPAALECYRTSPGGQLIVACQGDRVAGVSYAVSFGRTGWIGNVAVDPGARGQGLGTAVSVAALDALRAAGVTTVLLTATDLGRPIYERLGFGYDGMHYGIWRREPHPASGTANAAANHATASTANSPASSAARDPVDGAANGVGPGLAEQVMEQDLRATGEDRGAFLGAFADRARVPGDGLGYRVALPWGGGPVIASSQAAARSLLTDLIHTDAEPSLAFPEPNTAGAELAESLGFRQVRRIPRMHLGPPVPGFHPEWIFNVFSFAVG